MGSLYSGDVIRTALAEEGYQGGKGTSKFTRELDEANYWQMPPKDGCPDADWCSIFVNWAIYRSTRNSDGDIDPDKWDAHYFTFEPDSGENLAAGCGYAADYYMQHDAWSEGGSDYSQGACVGDQIFFRHFAHTGLVYDWDDTYVYTIEGNVNGNRVECRKYFLNDSSIDGYGHPRYDGSEFPTLSEPSPAPGEEEPKPTPTPEPTPEPEPSVRLFRVKTNSGSPLRLRAAPNIDSACLDLIPNGTVVAVSKIVDGEMINWNEEWAYTTYNGFNGYASCAYLVEE